MFWWDSPKIMCWIKAQICLKTKRWMFMWCTCISDLEMFRHHGEPCERLQWIFICQILLRDSRCTGHSSIWVSREKTAPMRTQPRQCHERQGTSQYGSGSTWIGGHVSVISRCLSTNIRNAATSALEIWKLRHWETQSHLPESFAEQSITRSSNNQRHKSQLTPSPANQRT